MRNLGLVVGVVVLALFLWILPPPNPWWRVWPPDQSLIDFAEVFGNLAGTLISSLALIGLVFTVVQQQRALKLQREDLKLNREELAATREELAGATEAQRKQVDIAQKAAQLNATSVLLDSATQELASPGLLAPSDLVTVRKEVEGLRTEIRKLRAELIGAVYRAEGSISIADALNVSGTGKFDPKDSGV